MSKAFRLTFILFYSFVALFIFNGCKKETVVIVPAGFNYFPTDIGTWVEYSVDSVYHSETDNNNDDSVFYYHFQLKEIIDSEFIDESGRENQIIKRYRRLDSLDEWTLTNVWTQNISSYAAYRIEDNISYHKLAFPMNTDITWNGNDANTLDEEMYVYEYVNQPATIQSLEFESTISVIQIDENNFVETFFGNEIYASGVGLIYKERNELGKRNGIVVKGMEYKMQVIRYGRY